MMSFKLHGFKYNFAQMLYAVWNGCCAILSVWRLNAFAVVENLFFQTKKKLVVEVLKRSIEQTRRSQLIKQINGQNCLTRTITTI